MHAKDPSTNVLPRVPMLELAAVELVVFDGPERGRRLRLSPGVTRIGTGAACALRLTDTTASRLHAEIRLGASGLTVADCGSTNGTRVDGVEIVEAKLVQDSVLQLGSTRVRVEIGERQRIALSPRESFGGVLGSSVEMRRVYAMIEKVAPTDATVLIQGETGTGKELVARAIHDASRRKDAPFVAVDCGAIAETLIESELFGHVRGAFSGASRDRRGLFEEADGGTIFLDEIGELPVALQPKLLRVLESREVRRVGGNSGIKLDLRVVAATHRHLARRVNEGTFREDLYYRLAVFELTLPPLRARREDIAILARHFHRRITGDDAPLPAEVNAALMARSWPGNVRELRNFVERNACLGWSSSFADRSDPERAPSVPVLEGLVDEAMPLKDARVAWNEKFEALYVAAVLRRTSGNVTRAAQMAGVNRRYLHRLIAEHRIRGVHGTTDTSDSDDE